MLAYMRAIIREREGHLTRAGTPRSERALRQLRATYYGLMTEVDDQIGRLVAHLRRQRQL